MRPDETGVRGPAATQQAAPVKLCWLCEHGTSSAVFTGKSVDETLVARFPLWQMWTEAAKLNCLNEGNAKSAAALTRAKTCWADCRLLTYPLIQITTFSLLMQRFDRGLENILDDVQNLPTQKINSAELTNARFNCGLWFMWNYLDWNRRYQPQNVGINPFTWDL